MLAVLVVAVFVVTLMVGQTFYPPGDVLRVILGEDVPGASFTVGRLRLPRAVLAVARRARASGSAASRSRRCCATRWPAPTSSASRSGASAAAAVRDRRRCPSSGTGGVGPRHRRRASASRCVIYLLSFKDGVAGTRLILIGIGIAAMLNSVTAYVLSEAGAVGPAGGDCAG